MNFLIRVYFSIEGRCSRKFYWLFGVVPFAVIGAFAGGWAAVTGLHPNQVIKMIFIMSVVLWPPSLVVQSKRWHDIGLPWWLCLLSVVPYFGILVWVGVGLVPGNRGDNKYGPDPASYAVT